MIDRAKWPLSRKILGLALLNLVLIAAVLAIFAESQFGLGVESLVLGPARDRVMAIANALARDLDSAAYSARGDVLESYSRRYGVDFFLIDPRGASLGGPQVDVPQAVIERLRRRPRGPGRGGRGRGEFAPENAGASERDGRGGDPGLPFPGAEVAPGLPGAPPAEPAFLVMTRNPLLYWVGVRIPTSGADGERGVPAVLLLRANSIFNSRLFFDWRSLLLLAVALGAVGLACWWPFLRGVTRSIGAMDRATEQIAQGRFNRHVTLARRDELGHLGEQINRMATRLEGLVKHQKRFLGDIAHELCAPIARVQFALGILEQKTDPALETHVAVLRDEIQEMSNLVNELLMFSKAGVQPGDTPLKYVEVEQVVRRAVAHQVPGAGTIEVSIAPALAVAAHEPYLVRAISNLLRNALRYAGEEGPVLVTARREGDRVLISVADCGPGLPDGSHEDVFAPFYRLEDARGRDTGGAGLGLAIVKSCIEACRGSVVCTNRQPAGLEVTIALAAWRGQAAKEDLSPRSG